jgi:two-component system LytT family response regulator
MAVRCIAIDDEPLALKQIGSYISKTPFLELSAAFRSALDAMEYLAHNTVDILFVDINMPDLSGLDFVKSLSAKPLIVFTTAHSDYAIDGFRVDATDFLLKPFGYNEFLAAVNKARARMEMKAARPAPENPGNDHIFVKSEYKLVRINLADIDYIESMHEYVRIHLSSGKPVMTLLSLKAIEEQLPAPGFLRVHRSYIVNSSKIKIIERNRIVFDKVHIPVSDQYKQAFQEFLNRSSIE